MVNFIIDIIFNLLGSFFVGSSTGLNTKKIDKNIELLKKQDWFKRIYEDEMYHKLFFTNKNVRSYLQSNFRVNKIVRNEKAQKKFLNLLHNQLRR